MQLRSSEVIYQSNSWIVALADDQTYLGRSVVQARRRVTALHELTMGEWFDFHERVVKPFERGVSSAFGADLVNWVCNMNHAYRRDPPSPHVHWHIYPRYRRAVQFAGLQFVDDEFGEHVLVGSQRLVGEDVRERIRLALRVNCR